MNYDNIIKLIQYDPDAIFLGCGCSDGEFTLKVVKKIRTQNIFGIEITKELIDNAKKKGINVRQADLNGSFPFENGSIDVLVANQVIEHLYDTDSFLNEVYRVLKRGGTL